MIISSEQTSATWWLQRRKIRGRSGTLPKRSGPIEPETTTPLAPEKHAAQALPLMPWVMINDDL